MKNEITLSFMREEINHVQMEMSITEADQEEIRYMGKDQLYGWITDKQMEISYADTTEAKASRFYEWRAGKEYCEGEGEKGLFGFELSVYRDGTRTESTPLGVSHATEIVGAGGNSFESFVQPVCSCGWKGKTQSCYNNWQMRDAGLEANRHVDGFRK